MESRLHAVLDELIGRWCDRRALDPLRALLAAWPSPLGLSDEWHELWQALRTISGLPPEALTPAEHELHREALRLVHAALRAVDQAPS